MLDAHENDWRNLYARYIWMAYINLSQKAIHQEAITSMCFHIWFLLIQRIWFFFLQNKKYLSGVFYVSTCLTLHAFAPSNLIFIEYDIQSTQLKKRSYKQICKQFLTEFLSYLFEFSHF